MVRKKRKGLVKESLAHGDSTGAPAAADMLQIVAHVPLNALVPFVLELDGRKPNTDASVTNDLATWYAALSVAPSRFDQLKLLQLFRASVKKLSGAEQGYATFAEATWRLFFRLYGAFSDVVLPLQKNFALVLQDLTTISSTGNVETLDLEKIAREELRAVLDALFETTKSLKNNADELVKVISHLQMLMEFPYVLKTLIHDSDSGAPNSYLRRTVAFLADQLDVLVTPIGDYLTIHGGDQDATVNDDEDEDTGASGPTNAVLKASERCSFALKCIIVLGSLKETLLKQLSASPSVSFAEAAADFARLLNHCTLILKTRVVHKDLLTQTGLAYSLLVRLLLNGSAPESPIVELLFRAVYPSVSEVGVGMGAELKDHVINDMKAFGEFARLAVFRGFINSLSDDELVKSVGTVLSSNQDRSILDYVFTTVHEYCAEESLNVRLYAFQVLEAFLRRAVGVISKSHVKTVEPIAKSTITNLTAVVLLNWENPSKRVNQFMHLMFTHTVNFQVLSGSFDAWKGGVVAKLIQLPQHSRARYGGLSILVTRYGAVSLLEEHPELLQSILYAVGIKDVSAAAAALFTQVLDELNQSGKKASEEELLKWRSYWVSDVVSVLLSKDAKLRSSVAMYALPLLLKKDPECVPGLITKLRASSQDGSKDVKLWAIIEVLKFARKKISPEKLLGLSMEEIQLGLENSRPEARGSAFEALCASLKSTNLPTPDEVRLIQRYLVISAKEITASTRMNSLNSLKTVFFRVKEFLRINTKESTDTRVTDEQKKQQAQEVARAKAFQQWLEHFVVTSVYPGSLVQRSIVGLEVLLLYLQVFGLPSTSESLLMTPHMVTSLLNMLIGSWDVIRALANTILDLYPAELPGFTTDAEMGMLWKWAMTLCISPRQRESDAGAHFMQLLYRRSESVAAHNVAELPSILPSGINIKDSRVRMILKLTDIISGRLAAADISRGESPLVHGLLLSLRYIIDGTDFFTLGDVSDEWKVALGRVFECVQQSMKLSLAVVGDATSGVGDESLSETFEGVVGEVSAAGGKTSAIPLRVDCRGHLILEDAEGNAEANDDADTEQRAVVGSWLAARECGAILDTIMRRVPLPSADNVESNFFPAELARQGGEMLLNSLFELKHKGAVATAYESFEGICKSFLAHGEKNPMIGSLPSAWADKLLDRLERSEQQFILRRSSGFAYSFVAILRAEPRNTAAIILPRVMTNLLRLASQDTDAMTAAAAPHQQAHLVWRSRVHALNILKLISQDAVLSDDVAVYVSQMIEYAIFGFECRSWVVRNSSMMLFAAATQRALGDKRIADGASKNKIPSAEVFSRFPQLDGFLYRALERFTDETRAENGVAPPGLFPVLMFLSRLRPTDEDEDDVLRARGSKPLADFVPLVMKCASQSVLPIRHMAAQVLGTIVRVDKAIPVLRLLSEELPEGVRAPTCASTGKPKSANYVHGVLLQAQSLIEKCLTTSSVDADDALAFIVSEFLPKHFWLSSGRVKASSIRAVVWEIIEAVFRGHVERTSRFTFGDLFEGVSNAVLVAVDGCLSQQSVDNSNRVPGEYKLNRAVVGTFFCLVKLNWKSTSKETAFTDTWLSRIEALLQCPVLEVRKRAFKQLDGFLHSSSFEFSKETPILVRLRAVLLKQLLVESHPTVKARLLQLLIEIQDSVVTKLEPANVDAIQTFLNLLATSANVDVIGPSLRLLAASVRDGAKSDSVLKALKDNVVSRSSESQPLGVRFAAAVAIERSQLLVAHAKQASGTIEIAVDAWLTVIKLLQDDDSHVRDVARAAVYESLRELENGFALDESVSETALLPFAIGYIVKTFSSTSYGYEAISGMLLATVDAPTLLAEYTSGSKAKDWGDLCNRIFEAEGNNFYAEADLLAQLLATCVFSQSVDMVTLKTQVLEKLVESLKMLNDSHTREQWLGGMTYYASVFPTFYSLLCVGVAAVESLREGECAQLVSSLREQTAIAQPHLTGGHPLVVKALVALQQTSSKVLSELVFLSPEWAAIH